MKDTQCHNSAKIDSLKELVTSFSCEDELTKHKALANEIRLKILFLLEHESCCVCDLVHCLNLPVATVSQHLKVLKNANIVKGEQIGKFIEYRLVQS